MKTHHFSVIKAQKKAACHKMGVANNSRMSGEMNAKKKRQGMWVN